MAKTPLEEFAEAKRSGQHRLKTHPETEKNWPSEPVEDTDPEQPKPGRPVVIEERRDFVSWLSVLNLVLIVLVILYLFFVDRNRLAAPPTAPDVSAVEPKSQPPEIRTIVKVKKVLVAGPKAETLVREVIPRAYRVARENLATAYERIDRLMAQVSDDYWRKKACFTYRDWDACLAYEKGLPSAIRMGRMDLR